MTFRPPVLPACRVLVLVVAWLGLALVAETRAERLPLRAYSTTEGLAHNAVHQIVRDARGFLWFATGDGLSRFDGYGFVSFSVEHGLPHRTVTDLLQTRSGDLWVATLGGLVRFRPERPSNPSTVYADERSAAPPMFTVFVPADDDPRARAVTVLLEGGDGTVWCGTRKGLLRLAQRAGTWELVPVDLAMPDGPAEGRYVNDLLEDEHRSLWVGTPHGLYRRWENGTTARYTRDQGLPSDYVHDLLLDRDGSLWVASRYGGVFRLSTGAGSARPTVVEHYGIGTGLHTDWISELRQTSDGAFWIATHRGLVAFTRAPAGQPPTFDLYTRAHGLRHQELTALAEDTGGNLWIGTAASGAMKLVRHGFVTFGEPDGVVSVNDVFEDSSGSLFVRGSVLVDRPGGDFAGRFGRFNGRGFDWFEPPSPFFPGWVFEQVTRRASDGEWWIAGGLGLYRYPPLPAFERITTVSPTKVYTTAEGLAAPQVYRLFADSRGDIWASTLGATHGLVRWDRTSETVVDLTKAEGAGPIASELARAFGEDADGSIWIGFDRGVARYRAGAWAFFDSNTGLPAGAIVSIHRDATGRLWLGSARGGLVRVEDAAADRPRFTAYTTAQGLSGNRVDALTDDLHGRIYVATGLGIDQLDPQTGRVRLFTTDEGLAPGNVIGAYRDRTGTLWFGTHGGLSRFSPPPPVPSAPPAILITRLSAGGEPREVSAIGETEVALGDLAHDRNQLQVEFIAPVFTTGETFRYQYRLEGANQDWGPATRERSVSYASLSPGRYRFLVRAINADGVVSPHPAAVTFFIVSPFWQRWWFLTLSLTAIGAALVALHRYRLARTLELERLRTAIATDLHDDVGANLTRIAILSEVTRQQAAAGDPQALTPLASIATIARESVAAMSDIVWAINPERDTLQEVIRKMRDHAEEVFEAREVALTLDLPDITRPARLAASVRRDLYLIFKEAVNNVARHSRSTRVSIALGVTGSGLVLEVTDDGVGFDAAADTDGNGLTNMRRRAGRLRAALDIRAAPGAGTIVRLVMPVGAQRAR